VYLQKHLLAVEINQAGNWFVRPLEDANLLLMSVQLI
jgi:hypothetical protein